MRHVFSLFCSHVVTDRDSNNISLFNVIEQVRIESPITVEFAIAIPFEGALVTLWARDQVTEPEKCFSRTRFIDPEGRELGSWTMEVDLSEFVRWRNRIGMNALRIGGPGIHEWVVETADSHVQEEWKEVQRIPFQVLIDEGDEDLVGALA